MLPDHQCIILQRIRFRDECGVHPVFAIWQAVLHGSPERTLCALGEECISPNEFKGVYEQARRTRAAVRGFINYLKKPARHQAGGYEERKETNREP